MRRRGEPGADRGRERGPPHARAGLEEAARQRAGGDATSVTAAALLPSFGPAHARVTTGRWYFEAEIRDTAKDGAVTVDWVVLTAAIVGLGIGAFTLIESESTGLSADVAATVGGVDVTSTLPAGTSGG